MNFDEKRWNANACACRCLIELARRITPPRIIEPAEIFNRFAPSNSRIWDERPGSTDTLLLARILSELPFARYGVMHVDHERLIAGMRSHAFGCFGFTDLFPDETGKLCPTNHVMLILQPTDTGFNSWIPLTTKDGDADSKERHFGWQDWYTMKMRGMLLCGYLPSTPWEHQQKG